MDTPINPTRIATKWALINAAVVILITYAIEFAKVEDTSAIRFVAFIPLIIFLFLTQIQCRNSVDGQLTFKQAFSAGFRFAVFTGIFLAIFTYVYVSFLNPTVLEKSMAATKSFMVSKGMSREKIAEALENNRKMGPAYNAFQTAINYALIGVVVSLIGASIFKKDTVVTTE